MSETSTLIGYSGRTIGREELALVPTPPATETHRPIPHHEIVQALIETLGFRHIGVVHDEYAVSPDGMKMFGVLDLATEMEGCRFSIGLRNSHDKSMRLAMTCGYRVFVCSNMAFSGDFTPVLAKHSKSFSLIDCISVGVDRMQRNFEPMRKQVEAWQRSELTDVTAKVVIYEAFVEGKLEAPKHLARTVHDLYFEPKYEEFRPRTIWSLSNAFTSAFKELEPIPQFKATAKLGNSWRLGSRRRFNEHGGAGRTADLVLSSFARCCAGAEALPPLVPEVHFGSVCGWLTVRPKQFLNTENQESAHSIGQILNCPACRIGGFHRESSQHSPTHPSRWFCLRCIIIIFIHRGHELVRLRLGAARRASGERAHKRPLPNLVILKCLRDPMLM